MPNPTTLFPDYPVIISFQDDDVTESSTVKKGYFLAPGIPLEISKFDDREPFDFVPSGFYLKAKFKTSNSILPGQKIRVNFIWGKLKALP